MVDNFIHIIKGKNVLQMSFFVQISGYQPDDYICTHTCMNNIVEIDTCNVW